MPTDVIGKRSFVMFYLALLGFCLFYFLLGVAVFEIGLTDHGKHANRFNFEDFGMLAMFIAILVLTAYTIRVYIKSSPSIQLNKDYIKLGFATYYWSNLEEISLTGKKQYMFNDQKEGVMLKFKGEKELCFLDEMYINAPEIKNFIQCHIIGHIDVGEIPPRSDLKEEQFITYKGKMLLNYRSFLLWCFIGLLIYGSISNIRNYGILIFFLSLGLGAFKLFSWYVYYFDLSDNYFVVRNHNMFWSIKVYPLTNIQEIVFEHPRKMPGSVRVITKDFESKLFRAGTISDRQWIRLKDELEKSNVAVRDEFIYAIVFYEFTFFKEIRAIFRRSDQ